MRFTAITFFALDVSATALSIHIPRLSTDATLAPRHSFNSHEFTLLTKRQTFVPPNDPEYLAYCKNVAETPQDNIICPVLNSLTGAFQFQADDINTQADTLLKIAQATIGQGNPTVQALTAAIGTGVASNILYSSSAVLYAIAVATDNVDPDCTCNIYSCESSLIAAKDNADAGTEEEQAACEQAKYQCAAFYTPDAINTMIPQCAQFTQTTGQ